MLTSLDICGESTRRPQQEGNNSQLTAGPEKSVSLALYGAASIRFRPKADLAVVECACEGRGESERLQYPNSYNLVFWLRSLCLNIVKTTNFSKS